MDKNNGKKKSETSGYKYDRPLLCTWCRSESSGKCWSHWRRIIGYYKI